MRRSRRQFLGLAGVGLLAGCGSGAQGLWFNSLKDFYNVAVAPDPGIPLAREQIEKQPFAMIAVKTGRRGAAIMVLAFNRGGELNWHSRDKAVVATRGGRIVRTVGLPENIRETRPLDPDPAVAGLHRVVAGARARRIVDFDGHERFGRVVEARYRPMGRERVEIAGLTYDLLLVVEENRIEVDDWEFENRFWVDPGTGFVWRSEQHVSPEFDPFVVSVLKPAG